LLASLLVTLAKPFANGMYEILPIFWVAGLYSQSKTSIRGTNFFKARQVVQGHKDREKAQLVHNSTTLMQSSTNLILSFAALFRFRVWNQDVTQAYTQSALALMRKSFSARKKDLDYFEMTSDEVLQLLRPLYGLADAGDYWNATIVVTILPHW
jgi:hypothetical protein